MAREENVRKVVNAIMKVNGWNGAPGARQSFNQSIPAAALARAEGRLAPIALRSHGAIRNTRSLGSQHQPLKLASAPEANYNVAPQTTMPGQISEPQKTEVWIGYTEVIPGVHHAVIVMRDPKTGQKIATRVGPNWFEDPNELNRLSMKPEVKPWMPENEGGSKDFGNTVHWQRAGELDMSLQMAEEKANAYANELMKDEPLYAATRQNSNSYAFSFLRRLGLDVKPRKDVYVPGFQSDVRPDYEAEKYKFFSISPGM